MVGFQSHRRHRTGGRLRQVYVHWWVCGWVDFTAKRLRVDGRRSEELQRIASGESDSPGIRSSGKAVGVSGEYGTDEAGTDRGFGGGGEAARGRAEEVGK